MKEQDRQAALAALDELDADQDYLFGRVAVDGSVAGAMAKSVRDKLKTIRAALTAQLTKTDDNVSCPNIANMGDINAELLERAKALVKYCEWQINEGTDHHPTLPSAIVSAKEAISRAKQKGGK